MKKDHVYEIEYNNSRGEPVLTAVHNFGAVRTYLSKLSSERVEAANKFKLTVTLKHYTKIKPRHQTAEQKKLANAVLTSIHGRIKW